MCWSGSWARRFSSGSAAARLTEAGRALLPHGRRLLAAARDGAAAVRALEQEESGTVALALVGTLASTALTTQLRRFRAAHPRVRLLLRTARSDEVSALVQRGAATLGLRYFADPDPAVVSRLVRDEALVVVCAARSRLAERPSPDLSALAGVPWVTFPADGSADGSAGEPYARIVERQLHGAGLADAEVIPIDSLTAQKRLIEADFGLGLLPASSIDEEVRLGTLHMLEVPALRATLPVMAIHRRQGYLSRAARRLLTDLTDRSP